MQQYADICGLTQIQQHHLQPLVVELPRLHLGIGPVLFDDTEIIKPGDDIIEDLALSGGFTAE